MTNDTQNNMIFGMTADDFLNQDVFHLLNVKNISQDEKQELLKKMLNTIQIRVIARIDDMLNNQDKQNQFKQVLSLSNKEINDFFKKENIDIKALLMQETFIYKTELVSLAKNTA